MTRRELIVARSWPVLAVWIGAAVLALSVYRAATQSITHDEAITYLWFQADAIANLFHYNTTNHVLFTLLSKCTVSLLGPSELSLRLPTLGGAAMYVVCGYLLCRRLFGRGPMLPLVMALICLNPLLLDFLAAARGYGLGVGLLMTALCVLVVRPANAVEEGCSPRRCAIASALLGLSVTCNLTFLIPAVAIGAAWAAFVIRPMSLRLLRRCCVLPAVGVTLFFMLPFLLQARRDQFCFGFDTFAECLRHLFEASFLSRWTGEPVANLEVQWSANPWATRGPILFFAFVGVILAVGMAWGGKHDDSDRSQRARPWAAACAGCAALLLFMHAARGVKYPLDRTFVYAIPMVTIAAALVLRAWRAGRVLGVILAGLVLCDYLASLRTDHFRYVAYDARSRQVFNAIAMDAAVNGRSGVRVGGNWWYEPALNFYRRQTRAGWMAPYQRNDAPAAGDYDYLVYTTARGPGAGGCRLRVIYTDAGLGLSVAAVERTTTVADGASNP